MQDVLRIHNFTREQPGGRFHKIMVDVRGNNRINMRYVVLDHIESKTIIVHEEGFTYWWFGLTNEAVAVESTLEKVYTRLETKFYQMLSDYKILPDTTRH